MSRSPVFAVGVALFAAACGARKGAVASEADSRLVISAGELAAVGSMNVYDAIRRLRHEFLDSRGETSLSRAQSQPLPVVYLDGMPYGSVAELRSIPVAQVARVRLYRSWEAMTKYGAGNMSGVLEVTTKQ